MPRAAVRGFSLVELVLVMTILTMTFAIAAPRYQHALSNYRASAAVQRVIGDLNAARRAAEQTGRTQSVSFDLNAHTITYQTLSLDQEHERTRVTHLAGEPYEARLHAVDFDGAQTVRFNGYGEPDRGGTVVIEAGGRRHTIVLDAVSGRAQVQ